MTALRKCVLSVFATAGLLVAASSMAAAGNITVTFSGTTSLPISTIPQGTAFTGKLVYSYPQTATITSFYGGTQSEFTFDSLSMTMNGQSVSTGAGSLGLYNDVTPPNGVPVGDSFYTFVPGIPNNSPNPSTGSIDGVTPNFIYLGFVDKTGAVFSGPGLPGTLSLAAFSEVFLGIDYGPLGTGNTDTISPITSLSTSGSIATPEPGSSLLIATGLMVLAALRRKPLR